MAYITITPKELAESAHKFRRELLTIPAKRVAELANYMTPRPGVTYKETVGSLSGDVELAPYDPLNVDKSGFNISSHRVYKHKYSLHIRILLGTDEQRKNVLVFCRFLIIRQNIMSLYLSDYRNDYISAFPFYRSK